MYLTMVKTLMVEAMRSVFQSDFPEPDFRNLGVDIEYPVDRANYPSIWVDYTDTEPVKQVQVGQVVPMDYETPSGTPYTEYTRWSFGGTVSFTVVALSSLERDRLYDQMVRSVGMLSAQNPTTARFRSQLESNDFIGVNARYDSLQSTGNAAMPGTPWGTDEVIYERTINLDIEGEFWINPSNGELLRLSAIKVVGADPYFGNESGIGGGPTPWI